MAIFHFRQQVVTRGEGRSAVALAAYRHAAKMVEMAGGPTHDYVHKGNVVHSEFALPDDAPSWAHELGTAHRRTNGAVFAEAEEGLRVGPDAVAASDVFWNLVEATERRKDAQLAFETVIALPVELTRAENIALMREFVAEHYISKGRIADWAYHDEPGNPHVHLMTNMRPLVEGGLGRKTILVLNEDGTAVRSAAGNPIYRKWTGGKDELFALREGWAVAANLALARVGLDVRIDHRSHEVRGIATEPTQHRGVAVNAMQVTLDETEVGDDVAFKRRQQFETFRQNPQLVVDHLGREHATFGDREIAALVWRFAPGGDEAHKLLLQVGALDSLVVIQSPIEDPMTGQQVRDVRYTTHANLEIEAEMGRAGQRRIDDTGFGLGEGAREAALSAREAAQDYAFTPEQRAAVAHVTGGSGMAVVAGYAGAGKSTVMSAVREAYEADGRTVFGGSLSGKAAQGLEVSAGIRSRTLASWEKAWENGIDRLDRGSVFVLDEAGMVASAQMGRMLRSLDEMGAKVVLVGDARQLQPIEAGAAFRAFADMAGRVELTSVRRQQIDWQADASVSFARGDALAALATYKEAGNIAFRETRMDARADVLGGWFSDQQAGRDVTMLAHTNLDVQLLNEGARAMRKAAGELDGGAVMQTERGEREFAIGDRIVFLRNDRRRDVQNGLFGTVVAVEISEGAAQLEDDVRRPEVTLQVRPDGRDTIVSVGAAQAYIDVDHGYAATLHKAQGATIDRVHVLGTNGFDAQLSYVAMTRHRDDVRMTVALDSFKTVSKAGDGEAREVSPNEALARLASARLKGSTLDHRDTIDYRLSMQDLARLRGDETHAQRVDQFSFPRGYPLVGEIAAGLIHSVERARDRFDALRERFTALIDPRPRLAETARQVRDHLVGKLRRAPPKFPEMADGVSASLHRVWAAYDTFGTPRHGESVPRGYDRYMRRASHELTQGDASFGIAAFNRAINRVIPRFDIVAAGPDPEAAMGSMAQWHPTLDAGFKERLFGNWRLVYAAQRAASDIAMTTVKPGYAETLGLLAGLRGIVEPERASEARQQSVGGEGVSGVPRAAQTADSLGINVPLDAAGATAGEGEGGAHGGAAAEGNVARTAAAANAGAQGVPRRADPAAAITVPEPRPVLYPAFTGWTETVAVEAAEYIHESRSSMDADVTGLRHAVGRVWAEPGHLAARIELAVYRGEDTCEFAKEVRASPEDFGELRGGTFFGRPNAARKAALASAAVLGEVIGRFAANIHGEVTTVQQRMTEQRAAWRSPMLAPSRDVLDTIDTLHRLYRTSQEPSVGVRERIDSGQLTQAQQDAVKGYAAELNSRFPFTADPAITSWQMRRGFAGQAWDAQADSAALETALKRADAAVTLIDRANRMSEREVESIRRGQGYQQTQGQSWRM